MDYGLVPLLTIAIPAYNGASNYEELFASIQKLGLHEEEYEVLVVDNDSNDGSDEVIKRFKQSMPNLWYHKNEKNIGRIENWNRVVELTRGEYLIIMNVNDRFEEFDTRTYIQYLEHHREIPMVLTDIEFADHVYPNWLESGEISLEDYVKKTFLDPEYLEFHSVGLLHQHIFRTSVITQNKILFDADLPRTTDRVFVGEVIKAGGGRFYYVNKTMVSWHLNKNRYHYSVHANKVNFDFQDLWLNEYKANLQLAEMAEIPYHEFLRSQLMLACFYSFRGKLLDLKRRLNKNAKIKDEMDILTADVYYHYIDKLARLNHISFNHPFIKMAAFCRYVRTNLRFRGLLKHNKRTLKGLINEVEVPEAEASVHAPTGLLK